ncbi:MAG: hypothetical protein JSW04_04000, partial [Desulfobacterales bacterium]
MFRKSLDFFTTISTSCDQLKLIYFQAFTLLIVGNTQLFQSEHICDICYKYSTPTLYVIVSLILLGLGFALFSSPNM